MSTNPETDSIERKVLAITLLIVITIIWGSTFIITKLMTQEIPIFLFLGLRHLIALICLMPILFFRRKINKRVVLTGSYTGIIYFFAIIFQSIGLQTTTAGNAAFITSLSMVMIPFIIWIGFKKKVHKNIWIAVILSICGVAFLYLENMDTIIIGDLFCLLCALFTAILIIFNDKFVKGSDVYFYTFIQIAVTTLLCFIFSFSFGESYDLRAISVLYLSLIIYLGLMATALAFLFINWSQKHLNPSQTSLTLALEPVFAVFFAFLIVNEQLTLFRWLGCAMIFCAIIIVQKEKDLKPKERCI